MDGVAFQHSVPSNLHANSAGVISANWVQILGQVLFVAYWEETILSSSLLTCSCDTDSFHLVFWGLLSLSWLLLPKIFILLLVIYVIVLFRDRKCVVCPRSWRRCEAGSQGEDEWKRRSLECGGDWKPSTSGEDGQALGRNSLRCSLAATTVLGVLGKEK